MYRLCFATLFVGTGLLNAADWSAFRGFDGSGVATEAKIPETWDDKTNLRWKAELPGPGASSPVVWKDRVFVTCYSGYGDSSKGQMSDLRRHLLCLDQATGQEKWKTTVESAAKEDPYNGFISEHGYASTTPVTDGERVYVFFGKSGVLAFDFDGKKLWQVSAGTSSANRKWGSAGGIVLYKDLLIVNASEESRAIRALDKKSGKEVWKRESNKLELCYSTPLLASKKDGATELIVSLPGEVWGLNPDDGQLVWTVKTPYTGNTSPSPVRKDDLVFAFGGYPQTGTVAVRLGGKGDATETNLVWKSKTSSYVPSPIVHGEHLFWVNDKGIACCVEAATGKTVYEERLEIRGGSGGSKPVYASVVLAGDKIVAVSRSSGVFVYPVGTTFQTPKVNRLSDPSDFNASPAVSGKELYLRSNRAIYCIASK